VLLFQTHDDRSQQADLADTDGVQPDAFFLAGASGNLSQQLGGQSLAVLARADGRHRSNHGAYENDQDRAGRRCLADNAWPPVMLIPFYARRPR
jgi:hypothetical protein